ncbi:MAG: crosslink repair DNA glycosylase YcaQ family protein, partial [Leifsonia sp.]
MADTISPATARRVALAAQGFGSPHPPAVGTRQLNLLIQRLGLLQIDSVNVFERSHYLPVFARVGAYDKELLDRLTFAAKSPHTEYWPHEAGFIRREDWPLFQWRMDNFRARYGTYPDGWYQRNAS